MMDLNAKFQVPISVWLICRDFGGYLHLFVRFSKNYFLANDDSLCQFYVFQVPSQMGLISGDFFLPEGF